MLTEYDVQQKAKETHGKIDKSATAKAALKTLTQLGVKEQAILGLIFQYCGQFPMVPSGRKQKKIDIGLHEARKVNDRIGTLAQNLEKLADEFDAVAIDMRAVTPWGIYSKLPSQMRTEARLLRSFYDRFREGREGSKGRRPGKSGRNAHLFLLIQLIRIATGAEDKYYKEVSALVNAVEAGQPGGRSPESLKRKVERFQADDKQTAAALIEEAQDLVDKWKLQPKVTK